jgi:hypothetical protein
MIVRLDTMYEDLLEDHRLFETFDVTFGQVQYEIGFYHPLEQD